MKDITIKKKFNGFEVTIGCKDLVFETRTKLFNELSRYIANPDEVEKEYLKKYGDENEGNYITDQFIISGGSTDWRINTR